MSTLRIRFTAFLALLTTATLTSGAVVLAMQRAGAPSQAILESPSTLACLGVVALTLFGLLQSHLQTMVTQWFDRPGYDAEDALTELSDRLARANGVDSVMSATEELFAEIFAPLETLVFLEQKGGRFGLQGAGQDDRKLLALPEQMRQRLHHGEVLARYDKESGSDGPAAPLWRELGIDLLLPLRGAPVFGILALGKKRSGEIYSAKDVRFLKTACNQLALGLNKATLFDQMEEDAAISAALIRAQNEIAAALNAPDILERLCQITATALDLECSHTLLWDPDQEAFFAVSAYGDSSEQADALRLVRFPEVMLGDLTERLKTEEVVLDRSNRSPYHILGEMFRYQPSSMIIMPLRREGELIGLHLAGCRSHTPVLTSHHKRIASGIGHASSMALANAHLMEELAGASRVKSDFVASMSHELRTPLNHIIGYNDLLIDEVFGEISDEQKDTLQRVRRSSHNLLDLIEATLNLSRLDAHKMDVQVTEVNLPALVAEMADRLEHSCKKPGVAVEWKVREDVSTLHTDPVKLQMVLKNLVENGVKFTDRGRVVVDVRHRGEGVEFAVSDSGKGIPKDLQAAIFEPFRRVHDPTASPGVGLGLHIVRRLIDLMQGEITVASEVDLGSCFRVWLPFSPPASDEKDTNAPQARQPMTSLSPTVH